MVKKRNRRTRKKYKKRGGFTDKELKDCNDRLKEQGVEGMVNRRKMCVKSNAMAGLPTQEPSPVQPVQPITQPKEPTELKQPSGVESVIVPLEQEPEQPTQPVQGPGVQSVIAPLEEESTKPSIKDRAKALEAQFGETGMRKKRKALKTTVGACRAAVDKNGNKYYYNEANETTWDPTDNVCHPKDGIEKTGNKSGDCIGARYKGGEEYWYHPTKQFSTHNKNHPLCHENDEIKAEDIKIPEEPNLSLVRLIEPTDNKTTTPKKKRRKKKRRTRKSHQRAASERNRRKQMKENEARKKKQAQSGGKRRTKRKKSRKRRR